MGETGFRGAAQIQDNLQQVIQGVLFLESFVDPRRERRQQLLQFVLGRLCDSYQLRPPLFCRSVQDEGRGF